MQDIVDNIFRSGLRDKIEFVRTELERRLQRPRFLLCSLLATFPGHGA